MKVTTSDYNPFRSEWTGTPVPTDAAGRPLAPQFNTVGNSQTGLLNDPYNLTSQLDTRATEAIRGEALRDPGTMSKWGSLALAAQKNQNARQNAGAVSAAQSNLAMSGGLRSGARERIATAGANQALKSNQNSTAAIQTQDELNRQKWLGMLPQTELANAQYQTGVSDKNIGRALTEVNVGRGMQQQQYNEGMRAWGADRTAAAAAAANPGSGGLFNDDLPLLGGCFITTACVDAMGMDDRSWPMEAARYFRDTFMAQTPERAEEILAYYKTAPGIVERINEKPEAARIWKKLYWTGIVPFVSAIRKGKNGHAHKLYQKLITKAEGLAR